MYCSGLLRIRLKRTRRVAKQDVGTVELLLYRVYAYSLILLLYIPLTHFILKLLQTSCSQFLINQVALTNSMFVIPLCQSIESATCGAADRNYANKQKPSK